MYNPLTLQVAKILQDNLLKEARKGQGIENSRPVTHRLKDHLFVRLGDLLITAGLKLHRRYKPAVCSDLQPSQTGLTGR